MDFSGLGATVVSAVLAGLGFVFWHFISTLKTADEELSKEVTALKLKIAENYMSKDDFNEAVKELKEMLKDLMKEIKGKADKH